MHQEKVEWKRQSGYVAGLVGVQFANNCHFTHSTMLHLILLLAIRPISCIGPGVLGCVYIIIARHVTVFPTDIYK